MGVAAFFNRLETNPLVQDFVRGLALGIVGLTLTVSLGLAASSVFDWGGVADAGGMIVNEIALELFDLIVV